MKRKSMITMLVIALMLVLSLTVLSACGKNNDDNKDDPPATYSVTVTNGTGGGEYAEGATVKIKANAPETGKEFTSWTLDGVSVDDKTKAEITFTMPANAVTATANFGDVQYLFALENCTADKESAKFGEEVTFTADVFEDKRFVGWSVKGVDETGLDLTKSPLTITMPANDIVVAAQLEQLYKITIAEGCTTDKEWAAAGEKVTVKQPTPPEGHLYTWKFEGVKIPGAQVSHPEVTFTMPENDVNITVVLGVVDFFVSIEGGTIEYGDQILEDEAQVRYGTDVTIKANAPTGMRFTGWTIEGVTVENTSVTELTFTMPAGNVTATANYDFEAYTIKVTGGTANKTTAHYGDKVTITADAPETGMKFTSWTLNGVTVNDKTKAELTFTMPAKDVTATANYVFEDYAIKVTGGWAQVNDGGLSPTLVAHYGDTVKIKAAAPEKGKRFTGWTITGVDTSELVLTDRELTFTMPAGNVTATANYDFEDYEIKVTGGTANKTTAHYGDSITITADEITGKKFTGWTLDGVTVEDLSAKEITFNMPANNVTATAELRDLVKRSVTVQGGVAQVGDGTQMTSLEAYCGDTVTLTAYQRDDKTFVKWTIEGIVDTTGLDLTQRVLTFTMPDNNVTATAEFENVPTDLTFEGDIATSGELWYVKNDSKSFRLPLGSGQDSCTYTIELSNPAFTFKVYGSDGEVYIDENGEGVKSITIDREDNYTIEVINTGTAANCTLTVTKV